MEFMLDVIFCLSVRFTVHVFDYVSHQFKCVHSWFYWLSLFI